MTNYFKMQCVENFFGLFFNGYLFMFFILFDITNVTLAYKILFTKMI